MSQAKRVPCRRRALLASSAFDASGFGIVVTDAAPRILTVNPAFSRITGYEAAEVEGRNPSLLRSERQDAAFYAGMWGQLLGSGAWRGEIWDQRKDGSLFAAVLAVTALRDPRGQVRQYVGVFAEVTERKEREERLRELAFFDPLTGLPNRVLLGDRAERAIATARRDGARAAVLYIDVDGFKGLNDRFGHDVGDRTLAIVADCLVMNVRETDTVARVGGDEFVIVIPGVGPEQASHIAEKILDSLSCGIEVLGHSITIGASIGISLYPDDGFRREELIAGADEAMYAAKLGGRNRYALCHDEPLPRRARHREWAKH